jgi:hypothetical protein
MAGVIRSGTVSANDQSELKTILASILAKLDKLDELKNKIEIMDRESKERHEISNRESRERHEALLNEVEISHKNLENELETSPKKH